MTILKSIVVYPNTISKFYEEWKFFTKGKAYKVKGDQKTDRQTDILPKK